ncbi:hypothetical protein [Sphingobacterium sp. FBM7-1]|uniref:hypothetical protein n=1 Tax=Sphingobacterium sp. FBM7-1 TaxID=2886688 RepID=UPI001D125BBE|nr:hypothetical protein [Sphingobacterium sp. FBM7-1]MCC2600712.1 hypothetical protein [Sphingobacterium sp. FBM7-1]
MLRKTIVNLLLAFILLPMVVSIRHWSNWLNGIYKIDDAYYETLAECIHKYHHRIAYPFLPVMFLILILLPFQLIKDYFSEKRKPLSLLVKSLVFTVFYTVCYAFLAGEYIGYMLKSNPMSF